MYGVGICYRATGDFEQPEENYITKTVHQRLLYAPDDPEYRDAANRRAALHRPVVESAAEPEDPDYGDTSHCRRAFHRPMQVQ